MVLLLLDIRDLNLGMKAGYMTEDHHCFAQFLVNARAVT
jgi:hypothetical protein